MSLHVSGQRIPDAAVALGELEPGCCYGSAVYGPERCTCWEPVLSEPQREPQAGPWEQLRKCCHDCAFRAGSPEREEEGGGMPYTGGVFFCHQGAVRVVAYRHPTGAVVPADPGDYIPTQGAGRVWLADGRPGQICAGYAATEEAG